MPYEKTIHPHFFLLNILFKCTHDGAEAAGGHSFFPDDYIELPYSRTHESEADELGLYFMAMAGYNPQTAPDFWKRMEARGGEHPPEFLSTHPDPTNRIEDLNRHMPKAMSLTRQISVPSIFLLTLLIGSCHREKQWEGQEPVKKVNTESVPVQLQHKGVFDLGDGLFISNDFEGARLNGVVCNNDSLVTALIAPENTPINMSPWYAFKLWSNTPRTLYLRLTYPESASHRYRPKLSSDGLNWSLVDTSFLQSTRVKMEEEMVDKELTIKLSLDLDTLWVSAQELLTNTHLEKWIGDLETRSYVERSSIGESNEGRPIHLLRIGESDDQRMIMVLARQHPPEVPGFLAMQAFVETLCAPTEQAEAFRKMFNVYVVPMINPDGVYHGHWRHNRGGVDLNRDWADFNQPETAALRDFMQQKTRGDRGKFYFSVDFHSTFEDIYYTIDPQLEGNLPGLVPDLIEATGQELPGYTPNVRPNSAEEARITSTSFMFYEMGAEALTYEIGDGTPRDFIRQKGELTAIKLMELLLQ